MNPARRLLAAIAAVAVASSSAHAATIAYYRFEEGDFLTDSSGNSNTLTNIGSMGQVAIPVSGNGSDFPSPIPLTSASNGRIADFTATGALGVVSGFTAADSASFGTIATNGTLTIEAFINSGTISTSDPEDSRYIASQYATTGSQRSWSVQVNANEGFSAFLSGNGTGAFTLNTANNTVAAGNDYFFAFTYNAATTNATFYWQNLTTNGTLQSQTVSGGPSALFDANVNFQIGHRFDSNKRWNNGGYIDEVRISNTVLSSSQFLNVPEPSAALLVGLGLMCAGLRRRRTAVR